jgi:molecular chaperone GrpE
MAKKEANGSELEGDADFLESLDHVEDLPPLDNVAGINDEDEEDFDFDGHDAELPSTPSWIEDASGKGILDDNLDDFASSVDDELGSLGDSPAPDASRLFAESGSSDELLAAIEQRDSYLEALRQLQADFENYKKRVVRDQQEYAEMKSVKLMEELLPIVDNFSLALASLEGKDSATKKLRKGIELVYAELFALLEKQGLEKIDAEGAIFDPEFHDAVSHEDNGEHEQEIVTEVLREGYKVRGKVVRPAMVKVAK